MKDKKHSARNKLYWIDRGFSDEDASQMARSRMPGTIEYYTIFKGMNQIDAEISVHKFQSNRTNTLENLIRKYGDVDGRIKWDEYRKKQSYSNTYEYKKKKYGWTFEQYDTYNKNRSCTESNFVKRWGDKIGKRKWKDYCDTQSYTNSIEYFIEKYGKEVGTDKFNRVNFLKAHTLESYIERFGDIDVAANALSDYMKKFSMKTPYSRIADSFFHRLSNKIFDQFGQMIIFSHVTGKEWFIRDESSSFFFVDFYIPKIKYAIEFNGDYWHANPSIYMGDDIIKYPGITLTASEIWNRDAKKHNAILKTDSIDHLDIVWESEFRNLDVDLIDKHFNRIKELYENQTNN